MRVDDYFKVRCGDQVREHDGRHVGTVRAVVSNSIFVRWNETGWLSQFERGEIRPATNYDAYWP